MLQTTKVTTRQTTKEDGVSKTQSDEDPDGEVLTMDEWKQLCVEMDRLESAMEHETEESSSACDESYADNECKGTDINVCRWTASACRRYDGSFSPRHRGLDR